MNIFHKHDVRRRRLLNKRGRRWFLFLLQLSEKLLLCLGQVYITEWFRFLVPRWRRLRRIASSRGPSTSYLRIHLVESPVFLFLRIKRVDLLLDEFHLVLRRRISKRCSPTAFYSSSSSSWARSRYRCCWRHLLPFFLFPRRRRNWFWRRRRKHLHRAVV